jgi:hypothetical protein
MKKMILALCFAPILLVANIGPEGFAKYPNDYFVETGTFHGEGIVKAMRVGYKEIRSIDIDASFVEAAQKAFCAYPSVKIFYGDSSKDLWAVIKDIDKPITFWLDGHNIYPSGGKNCPLLEELTQIKKHPIKNHTILIDDMHCLNTIYFDYISREDIVKKIREINPKYQISYVVGGDSGTHPNNIMVATVP